MGTSGWKHWSEAEARRELAAWRRSGETLAKFARERGYTDARLRWWQSRLGSNAAVAPTALVPVRVVEREPTLETPIELIVRSGHVIRVRRGFDAEALAAVVHALEGAC